MLMLLRDWPRMQIRSGTSPLFQSKSPYRSFAVDVGELYQLFIAYSDDHLESVYPSSFYPPDRRVSAGDKANVLRQLKQLAEKA